MLSGCYLTDERAMLWCRDNENGLCRLFLSIQGTCNLLEHWPTIYCNTLESERDSAVHLYIEQTAALPHLKPLVLHYLQGSSEESMSFILDPSSLPLIKAAAQSPSQVLDRQVHYLTRLWCSPIIQLVLMIHWISAQHVQLIYSIQVNFVMF